MKNFHAFFALTLVIQTFAQPNTDIYLFNIGAPDQSPINISNNPGYDNQPSFWEDSQSILYARTVNGQTEIARYFIESAETEIITSTPQGSEYSPTQIPGSNDISSIRLDTSGLHLLYRYDLDGKSSVLVPDLKIGYHAWVNGQKLAAFVLGSPPTLQYIDVSTSMAITLEDSIGRCLVPFPTMEGFSFVDASQKPEKIFLRIPEKEMTYELASLPENSQDFCWSADGRNIYSSQGTKIVKAGQGQPWQTFFDLRDFRLTGKISRMAASPDGNWLAVVIEQ